MSASPEPRPWGAAVVGLLALALAQLSLPSRGPRAPLLRLAEPVRAAPPGDPRLEPRFQGEMTPDDVARGLLALSRQPEGALALRPDQRAALGPKVQAARAARAEVDALRDEQRRARLALLTSGHALMVAVGADVLAAGRR